MTQIVYTGKYLIADRRCFMGGGAVTFDYPKFRVAEQEDKRVIFAFCGGYLECGLGDKLIRSNYDKDVRKEILDRVGEEANDVSRGLLIEVPHDPNESIRPFLVSYAGDKEPLPMNDILGVGAYSNVVKAALEVMIEFSQDKENIPAEHYARAIRVALRTSDCNQDDHLLDFIALEDRENVDHTTL